MKKKKNILESIHHFDRFNSDLYMNVVNRKNNFEQDVEDYVYEENSQIGCIYLFILFIMVTFFIGLLALLYYVL